MAKKEKPFNNPFASIEKSLRQQIVATPPSPTTPVELPPRRASPPEVSDELTFTRAMEGTREIHRDGRGKVRAAPPPHGEDLVSRSEQEEMEEENAEVLSALADLVESKTRFQVSESSEFLEGCVEGLDTRILAKLKRGAFAVRGKVDLHGLTREPARNAVEQFILRSQREGHRCILIVHGRGFHSADHIPVLKSFLKVWLERGRIARNVLAFCSAQPHDGGTGAMYVLLRR